MKNLKNVLVASFLTLGAFTSVFMVSCNPDPCRDVVCTNGVCDDVTGACKCDAGYEGADCSTRTKTKFLGSYVGNGSDDQGGTYNNWKLTITETDTTSITAATFTLYNAANAQQMQFTGSVSTNGIITLNNMNTTNFMYTNGSGSVILGTSSSTANLTFKEADFPGGTNPYVYSNNN
jgi:hypothetical protein